MNISSIEVALATKIAEKTKKSYKGTTNPHEIFQKTIKEKLAEFYTVNLLTQQGIEIKPNIQKNDPDPEKIKTFTYNNKNILIIPSFNKEFFKIDATILQKWKQTNKFPDYIVIIAIIDVRDIWTATYNMGISWDTFKTSAQLYGTGVKIADTDIRTTGKCAIVENTSCGKLDDLIYYLNGEDEPPF